jgi:hypothetical protein
MTSKNINGTTNTAIKSNNGVILVSFSFALQCGHFILKGEEKCSKSSIVIGSWQPGQGMDVFMNGFPKEKLLVQSKV